MRISLLWLCLLLAAGAVSAADVDAVGGLKSAIGKNVEHASQWLEQRDYKSLNQSASGIKLLVELLKAKSDDAIWQSAFGDVAGKTSDVQSAASTEDPIKCQAALEALKNEVVRAEKSAPRGKPAAVPKAPPLRPLMLMLDAIQADAKVALLTGNVAGAKQQAAVLVELSNFVAGARSDAKWTALAGDFSKASAAAASSPETDPKAVRQLLRGVAERCEACHENARMR